MARLQGLQTLVDELPNDPSTKRRWYALADEKDECGYTPPSRWRRRAHVGARAPARAQADIIAPRSGRAIGDHMTTESASRSCGRVCEGAPETCVACAMRRPLAIEARELSSVLTASPARSPWPRNFAGAIRPRRRRDRGGLTARSNAPRTCAVGLDRGPGHMGSRARCCDQGRDAGRDDAETRREARQAVAEIQSRLQGASAGNLDRRGRLRAASLSPTTIRAAGFDDGASAEFDDAVPSRRRGEVTRAHRAPDDPRLRALRRAEDATLLRSSSPPPPLLASS